MKSIKITDIAEAAQVSTTTVARVLNNNGYVSQQKREAVQNAISQLGYVPNIVASGLRKRQTNMIGHVMPVSSENPFFARICASLESSAEKAGFTVITAITQLDPQLERKMVEHLAGMMVEVIVFTTETTSDVELIKWLISRGIHVVMIERPRQVSNIDVILLDSFAGASLAVEHLIQKGHSEIGFIGRECLSREVEHDRFAGFEMKMGLNGLEINKNWVSLQPDYSSEHGRAAMQQIIASGKLPGALLITSDVMACGVLQILYENKIRVPDDISIVSFDNTLSSQTSPKLTSIDLQQDMIGDTVFDMILECKNKKRMGAKKVTLSPVLIDRGSVADIQNL